MDKNDDVLIDWTFPGFICFVLYGIFSGKHDRLPAFKINDSFQCYVSIVQKGKEDLITTFNGSHNDSGNNRGCTIYQQINIETLCVQKMLIIQNANKTNLRAITGDKTAISKYIEAAERRTTIC